MTTELDRMLASMPDLGLMKTPYFCQQCIDGRYLNEAANEPTRDAIITNILACPKCGALDCTKNHAEFM